VEPEQGIGGASLALRLIKILLALRIRPLVGLQTNKIRYPLTFLRGLPRPRPLVGGARSSPPGPRECFCF
jgi:hypothetical protein